MHIQDYQTSEVAVGRQYNRSPEVFWEVASVDPRTGAEEAVVSDKRFQSEKRRVGRNNSVLFQRSELSFVRQFLLHHDATC